MNEELYEQIFEELTGELGRYPTHDEVEAVLNTIPEFEEVNHENLYEDDYS